MERSERERRKGIWGMQLISKQMSEMQILNLSVHLYRTHKSQWVPALPTLASNLKSLLQNSFLRAGGKQREGAGRGQRRAGPASLAEDIIRCYNHYNRYNLTPCLCSSVRVIFLSSFSTKLTVSLVDPTKPLNESELWDAQS